MLAAGLSIATEQVNALSTFVRSAKANGYWDDLVEVYPFCGTTLSAQLYKLKVHSSLSRAMTWTNGAGSTDALCSPRTGMSSNAPSGSGLTAISTGLVPATHLASNASLSFGFVLTGMNAVATNDLGCGQTAGGTAMNARCNVTPAWVEFGICEAAFNTVTTAGVSGFYIGTRTATTGAGCVDLYRNGTSIGGANVTATALPSQTFTLFGRNYDGTSNQTAHRQSFAFIGNGLTAAKCSNFSTDVAVLWRTLRRVL